MKKFKFIFLIAAVSAYAFFGTVVSLSRAADTDDELMQKVNAKRKPTCRRVKARINSALDLFLAENTGFSTAEVSVQQLVEKGYLRYEPACPEGGKYMLETSGGVFVPICDRCDGRKKNPDAASLKAAGALQEPLAETTEVSAVKGNAKKGDTLENRIDRYLGKDDLELLESGKKKQESDSAAKTSETQTALKTNAAGTDEDQITSLADASKNNGKSNEAPDSEAGGPEQIQSADVPILSRGARDYHAEALEHARRGEVDRAIEKFQRAIELSPDSFTYHYNYGLFQAKIENYDQAYVLFQRALRLNPGNKKVQEMIEKLKKALSSK